LASRLNQSVSGRFEDDAVTILLPAQRLIHKHPRNGAVWSNWTSSVYCLITLATSLAGVKAGEPVDPGTHTRALWRAARGLGGEPHLEWTFPLFAFRALALEEVGAEGFRGLDIFYRPRWLRVLIRFSCATS
jgi:hypothetical protein